MEIKLYDIAFFFDATIHKGFGHGSRCLKIAKILLKNNKFSICFVGDIDSNVINFMKDEVSSITFEKDISNIKSKVSFIDMMFDADDPNYINKHFIHNININSNITIILYSGVKVPSLPKEIICIGYQPSIDDNLMKNLFWSINYAPTLQLKEMQTLERSNKYAFIALGGYKNNDGIYLLINILSSILEIKHIDILQSPVNNEIDLKYLNFRKNLKIEVHHLIKSVSPFLSRSGIVLASYGNLCFEALAHGAPLGVLGQKKFQIEYANILEDKKVALAIGKLSNEKKYFIEDKIYELINNRNMFSKNASLFVKPDGLKRIADLILNRYEK